MTHALDGREAGRQPGARCCFASSERKAEALAALDDVERLLIWAGPTTSRPGLRAAQKVHATAPAGRPKAVWRDFEQRSPEFYIALSEVVDHGLDVAASEGFLSEDIVARVRAQSLDDRFRRVALRGYQSFGARFALVQRRVIIGDEMGLGKTIQAIAVLATCAPATDRILPGRVPGERARSTGPREIETRSHLKVHRLHGPDREAASRTG